MGLTKQCDSTSTTNYLALKSQIKDLMQMIGVLGGRDSQLSF